MNCAQTSKKEIELHYNDDCFINGYVTAINEVNVSFKRLIESVHAEGKGGKLMEHKVNRDKRLLKIAKEAILRDMNESFKDRLLECT
jgi:hypothetical protein